MQLPNGMPRDGEIPHQHRQQGKRFHIRIDLTVPGGEIVVNHEPILCGSIQRTGTGKRKIEQEVAAPHKDIYVAIRDAFKSARRPAPARNRYIRKAINV